MCITHVFQSFCQTSWGEHHGENIMGRYMKSWEVNETTHIISNSTYNLLPWFIPFFQFAQLYMYNHVHMEVS